MKKFIKKVEFAQLLSGFRFGSVIGQVMSETFPELLKKSRETGLPTPFKKVSHFRDLSLTMGVDYEKGINKQLEKEGKEPNFIAQDHVWAAHFVGGLARHKSYDISTVDLSNIDWSTINLDKLYVPYRVNSISESKYFADGKAIAKDILKQYFKSTDSYASQPVEKKYPIQYMKLSSILEFTWSGTQYVIVD